MVLDGAPVSARRLYELGGVNRVVPDGTSVDVALEWAERLAERPPEALAALKQILVDNADVNQTYALSNEQRIFQSVATSQAAIDQMKAIQDRFDAGESIRAVYGEARS